MRHGPRYTRGSARARPRIVRGLACAWLIAVAAGCTGRSMLDPVASEMAAAATPRLPAHRAVSEISIEWAGRSLALVGHLAIASHPGPVRAHIATDSGLTILDVEVEAAATRVHAETALAGTPQFAAAISADLARIYGSRSVFGLPASSRIPATLRRGEGSWPAAQTADGSWIASPAVAPMPFRSIEARTIDVVLLDSDGREEATVRYDDFDEHGIPLGVVLHALREGRVVTIDVISADVTPSAPASGATESSGLR